MNSKKETKKDQNKDNKNVEENKKENQKETNTSNEKENNEKDWDDILKETKKLEKDELVEKIKQLKNEKQDLEKKVSKIQDFEEIAKKAQSQYAMLKNEFDSYQNRIEKQKEKNKDQEFIKIMKKILPIIDNLRVSMENTPEDLEDNEWVKGVDLAIQNIENKLSDMGIKPIESIGQLPHHDYHEPVSTQNVDSEEKEGKIIKEYERGYVYVRDNDEKKVIRPAKVIVGK